MKPNRRSPVFRATAWFFALALILPVALQGSAKAQTQQQLRVIVADIVNKTPQNGGTTLGVEATAAVYNELLNTGAGRYYVFQTSEVQKEAQTLGIRTSSAAGQPNYFSEPDLLRIAKSLGADAVVQGSVTSSALTRGRPVRVSLDVRVHDMTSEQDINGGIGEVTTSPRPGQVGDPEELLTKAIADVAQDVIRQVAQRQLFVATILNVNGNVAIMNIGTRNSLHVGDELTVYRLSPAGTIRVGRLKAARVYPGDSEADILENVGGIQIEDQARIIYTPAFVQPNGTGPILRKAPHNNFSFGAIGATLTVIGLGVIVATAARGGQASVSGVTAEAGTQNISPIVRVRWSDNVFGAAGIQQYKIFRLPDFPFGTIGTGSNGGNGGGNTTTGAGTPVGVATPTLRELDDLPSPNFRYKNGTGFLVGNSNGGLNTGGNNTGGSGGGGGTTQGCNQVTPANAATLDVGFTPGMSYRYQITAVILRQSNLSSQGTNGTGGGGIGGGGGTGGSGGGGGTNSGGPDCIETDPVQSGLATPILPVILTFPLNQSGAIDLPTFNPTFASRTGADLFQLEISTDRTFKNPSRIFKQQIISTAPNSDGASQGVPAPIDLTLLPELLADPNFKNFLTSGTGTTTQLPTIFWRVGARHDEDVPGPINAISQNPSDPDRTFRFVYSQVFSFTPPLTPPAPPSRLAAQLNRLYNGKAINHIPLPGDTVSGRGVTQRRVLTPQEILTGAGRGRH